MSQPGPLDRLLALQFLGIKFGLDNIHALCAALGHPERRFHSVIVGGTNGKGSVTAMVDCALRAAGLRVARYTSPHLIRLEERFAIDGEPVDPARLAGAAARALDAADALVKSGALQAQPTFFEVTTAVAFHLFAEARVDVAVLEVGLGGRFDATNVVTPVAAAITTIDLDHQQFLGTTIRSIAFEKAGIVKPDIPVVVGERKPDAVDVIRQTCRERGARFVGAWEGVEVSRPGEQLVIRTPSRSYGPVTLALAGEHQVANAVVAVRLLEELTARFSIAPGAIAAGLRDVRWPGRLQWIAVADDKRLLLDSAHNPAGAAALARFLSSTLAGPIPIVLAVMRDKDAAGIVSALAPQASAFVLTRAATERALDPAALQATVRRSAPTARAEIAATPAAALDQAFSFGSTVCACGSIFLIGEILALVAERRTA